MVSAAPVEMRLTPVGLVGGLLGVAMLSLGGEVEPLKHVTPPCKSKLK